MSFLDNAQEMLDKGMGVAKGAVSTVAGEQLGFVRGFARMCQDGWEMGFHERNGGNASYRLTTEDVRAAQSFFYDNPSSWVGMQLASPDMAYEHLLVTGAGKYLRNVAGDPVTNAGIIEINATGDAWRVVWGFRDGSQPTSEAAAHVAAHAARKRATRCTSRVIYHAHPTHLVALTALVPADARTLTRILWKSLTETVIALPGGLGVVDWMVPGSTDLARATAKAMDEYAACVWPLHGMMASGDTFDAAFGAVHSADKAAEVYLVARAAQGGAPDLPFQLADADVRATAMTYKLPVRSDFLD